MTDHILTNPMDEVLEFLRSFISGGVNQDFKPWARELYAKLYGSPDEPNVGVSIDEHERYKHCLYRANGRLILLGQEPEKLEYPKAAECCCNFANEPNAKRHADYCPLKSGGAQ